MGREPGQATGGPCLGTIARHGNSVGAPKLLWTPQRQTSHPAVPFFCHCVHVHCLTMLGDGPRVVPMARPGRSTGAPCPLWTPRRPSLHRPFHFTPSNHGHATGQVPRYGTYPTMTCLGDPSRVTQWRSKPVHRTHNGDPKPGHTMQIQNWFTQWRSKPVHTLQSRVTQWKFKPVHIQAGSHNGDPTRFAQWRSKPVHTMGIQISLQEVSGNPFQITWSLSSFELYLHWKAYVLPGRPSLLHFFFEVPAVTVQH